MPPRRGGRRAFLANAFRLVGREDAAARGGRRSGLALALSALVVLLAPDEPGAATFAPLSQAPSERAPRGFQGIPWGAPLDAIEGRFGEAAERDDESCNDELSRQALAAEGHDCFVLKMDRYVLDGVPFSASFRFDPHNKGLGAVVLTSSFKSRNLTPKAVKKVQAECRENYDRMARQLAAEFPLAVLPHQVFEKPAAPFAKGSYRAWEGGDTIVRLRRAYDYTDHWKRWRRADGCELELRYAALPPAEEGLPE